MLCTEVLGNINDPSAVIALQRRLGGSFDVDPVDFEWDEVRGRIHRKRSAGGIDVGVRLGDWVLERGLADGDVLGCLPAGEGGPRSDADAVSPANEPDGPAISRRFAGSVTSGPTRPVVVAVRLLSARCLVIDVDPSAPVSLARTAWEVGNMHAPLFRGEGDHQLVAPYSEPLARMLARVPGLTLRDEWQRLDQGRRLSGNGITTVVRLAPDLKLVRVQKGAVQKGTGAFRTWAKGDSTHAKGDRSFSHVGEEGR